MKQFGKLLAEFRKKAGLSQNDLALLIKTNPTHISKIERGERNPPKIGALVKIAKALNLDKKESGELMSSALYSKATDRPFKYSSPLNDNEIAALVNEEKRRKLLESPAIKVIADILNDSKISIEHKKDIEKQIYSFVAWIKSNIKSKGENKGAKKTS